MSVQESSSPSLRQTSPRRLWALMTLGVVCYIGVFIFYPNLFWLIGVNHYGVWFLDSFAILASNDAVTRGLAGHLLERLFDGNLPALVNHLLTTREVSQEELASLEHLIAERKKRP